MTLSANRQEQNDEKDENNHYIRRERSWGSVSRSFDISGIDAQRIEASYQNGVLHLDLPKVHEQKTDSHSIQIR
jgi:HSP20 family protein